MSDGAFAFENGEKVRLRPGKGYPRHKRNVTYGIVMFRTRDPGMCLVDLDRQSKAGEEVYCLGKWDSRGRGGGSWVSMAGFEKMKRRKS